MSAPSTDLELLKDVTRDPVVTDGDKYKVLLENDRVRVLEYRDKPGQRTTPHHHPDFVLCSVSGFKRQFTLPDGTTVTRDVPPGIAVFNKDQCHIGENVGETDTHVIMIELKS